MLRISAFLLFIVISWQASALTFKSGESIDFNNQVAFNNQEIERVENPVAGIHIENSHNSMDYPPIMPSVLSDRYWFGLFWVQNDFNNDGYLDYIYTGTMIPNNVQITGDDTGGLCGGSECAGKMPIPSLFLGNEMGYYQLRDDLFFDNRDIVGMSSARQNLVADFNEDGVLDLFVADHAVGTHNGIRDSYFLSQPDGTWLESSETHLSHSNYRIFDHGGAVGDIDRDGDVDIVLTELKHQLTCWINSGNGYLQKRKCGSIHAFAIELGDMDGDGDLDIVHAGHENGTSSATGIAYNDGEGNFNYRRALPVIADWETVPELSLWDLDDDTDLDIVLSRSKRLYAGAGIQIIENVEGEFVSQFLPLSDAPADYVAYHEGNEWNNFIQNFLFRDTDQDGDHDIILVASDGGKKARKLAGSILRNDGLMSFTHIAIDDIGNPITIIPDIRFSNSTDDAELMLNLFSQDPSLRKKYQEQLASPVYFETIDSYLFAINDLIVTEKGYSFNGLFKSDKGFFETSVCSEYYKQYDFFGTRIGFSTDVGFAGKMELAELGVGYCLNKKSYAGHWEVDKIKLNKILLGFMEELDRKGGLMARSIVPLSKSAHAKNLNIWLQ